MESTLLLVDPEKLPRGLEEQVAHKGVFVETTSAEHLAFSVVAAAPDLVLAPHSEHLERVLEALRAQEPVVQVVLVADWKEHKGLRGRKDPVIGAVLAQDTPLKLLAGRVFEFCERAAAGQPLQRVPSLVPPAVSQQKGAPARAAAPRTLVRSEAQRVPARSEATPALPAAPLAEAIAPARATPQGFPAEAPEATPHPPSERIPLTFSQRPLPPVRVALVDRDPMRSGAIAEALRQRGVTSQLVAPDRDATRWHLLRRFSPHGLVVDERGLDPDNEWLDAIRLDPFLSHVPLLVVPLSRLFAEETGETDLSSLVPLLLTLGAEESAFQTRLGPGRELELRLDQIGPTRLFECLADHPRATRLECQGETAGLALFVEGGQAGGAEFVAASGTREPLELSQALEWILAHPDARVLVREASPPAQPSKRRAVRAWLEEATGQEAIPRSPPRRSAAPRRSTTSAEDARSGGWSLPALGPAWLRLRAQAARIPKRTWIGLGGLVGVVIVAGVVVAGRGSQEPPLPAALVPSPAPAEKPAAQPSAVPPPPTEGLRFAVVDAKLPACEESVSVAGESFAMAAVHLQKARQALMSGDRESARQLMCKAALLDPAGPASEGLAVLFLSLRSIDNAWAWAEIVRRNRPGQRATEELLGDVASQQGDVEASRSFWLSSMGLSGEETDKLKAVSRTLVKEAARAKKSSDLPRAERALRRAVTLDPAQVPASLALAELFLDQGLVELSEAWARHVSSLAPDEAGARLLLGELAERRGAHDEAREHYRKIPDTAAHAPKARERLARLTQQ